MCSFLSVNFLPDKNDISLANRFAKSRGPDRTTTAYINGHFFLHNLLSITGELTTQPLMNKDKTIVCLFNGEIYNYRNFGDYKNDGECIIPLYKEFGLNSFAKLDGEFAIVIYDFINKKIVVACDDFGTKPLWFGLKSDGKFGFASYKSSLISLQYLDIVRLPGNRVYVFDLNGNKQQEFELYKIDIENQHKTNYDDWFSAFRAAVHKRVSGTREKIFVCLSSGYDSGGITKEMLNQKINFKTFSIVAKENLNILKQRSSIMPAYDISDLDAKQYVEARKYLKQRCEEYQYIIKRNGVIRPGYFMTDDKGAIGLCFLYGKARGEGYKIHLSGQGADEVMSDYGKFGKIFYSHSTVAGKFPADLKTCFPWDNFYKGTQESYLAKEEHIAGMYGIESRYPFLDRAVVQEFMWLSQELKNQNYKAPLYEYLKSENVPFEPEVKVGFNCKPEGIM